MNLGVDLGSTYSSFSTYDIVNKNVELCKPVMSEPEAIPSIACLNDDGKMLTAIPHANIYSWTTPLPGRFLRSKCC